jgi:hypothetical protein
MPPVAVELPRRTCSSREQRCLDERSGQAAFGVARRHEQAGLAVGDDLRDAARGVATIGLAAGHRVEQRRAQPLGDRAHHEDVEGLEQRQHVGPEAGEQHVLLEVQVLDLLLERRRSSPSPAMTNRASGTSRTTRAAASTRCRCPLCGTSAPMLPTTGACAAARAPRAIGAGGAARRGRDRSPRAR